MIDQHYARSPGAGPHRLMRSLTNELLTAVIRTQLGIRNRLLETAGLAIHPPLAAETGLEFPRLPALCGDVDHTVRSDGSMQRHVVSREDLERELREIAAHAPGQIEGVFGPGCR